MMRPVPRSLPAGFGIRGLAAPRVAVAGFHCSRTLDVVSQRKARESPLPARIQAVNYLQQHQQLRTIATTTNRQQQESPEMAEPTGLVAKSGIELLTFG